MSVLLWMCQHCTLEGRATKITWKQQERIFEDAQKSPFLFCWKWSQDRPLKLPDFRTDTFFSWLKYAVLDESTTTLTVNFADNDRDHYEHSFRPSILPFQDGFTVV